MKGAKDVNDLIKYLFDFAFDHDIGVLLISTSKEYNSLADKTKKTIIINTNWKNQNELPFIIGHEIGHLMEGEPGLSFFCGTSLSSKERKADLFSLNIIFEYATLQYDSYEEPIQFIQQYGIPDRMLNDAFRLFKKNDDLVF